MQSGGSPVYKEYPRHTETNQFEYSVNLLTGFYTMRALVINKLTPNVQLQCGRYKKTVGLNILLQFFNALKIP